MPEKPTGVLPKNLQQWAMVGLTVVVVIVIIFSMISTPKPKLGSTAAEQELLRMKSEKEKQLEQLTKDQERAQEQNLQAQQQLQEALRNLPQPSPAAPEAPDPLQEAKIKREYTSLFASQLAKSYRSDGATRTAGPAAVDAGMTTSSDVDPSAQLAQTIEQGVAERKNAAATPGGEVAPSLASALAGVSHAQPPSGPPRPTDTPRHPLVNTMGRNTTRPGAATYLLLEGTVIETALVTRITSDFSGPVIVQASGPILTQNRQHILIPAGSKIIGEARRVEAFGQTRLAVYFHRLLMPDGFSVDLDREPALTARGESGLKDKTNNHYLKIFGSSIAVGLVGGLSSLGATIPTTTSNATPLDAYRLGVAGSLGQSASQILEKFLNILPTVTIREGHRVRVWISQDLTLPAYAEHAMPKDL